MDMERLLTALFRRSLSKRERLILFATILTVVGALVYRFPYSALVRSISATGAKIEAREERVRDSALRIADLKMRQEELKAGQKLGIKDWHLVDRKGVVLVLEDVTTEARRQGVNLLSVRPSEEIEKGPYREVSLNIDVKGRYRELARYFKRLESQPRLVNIRRVRVEACPDSSSACATQLEAVTYLTK